MVQAGAILVEVEALISAPLVDSLHFLLSSTKTVTLALHTG